MKNFSKNGAKFAAAIAMSVMALGYTTSVWAAENTEVTETGKAFENIKGTQTEILNEIRYRSNKADEVKAIGLDIHNAEKLNIVNGDEGGLFIGSRAYAYKKGESIGIQVKDAQADFNIKGNFVWQADCVIEEEIGKTEAYDVNMKAVGVAGENGSSLIKADEVFCQATVVDSREAENLTGSLEKTTLGMGLHKYDMRILAKKSINIYSMLSNKSKLSEKMTSQGMILSNGSKASLQAKENISILATVGDSIVLSSATSSSTTPSVSFGPVSGIYAASSELDMQAGGQIKILAAVMDSTNDNELVAIKARDSKLIFKAENGINIGAVSTDAEGNIQDEKVYAILADKQSEITLNSGESEISILGNVNVLDGSTLKLLGNTAIGNSFARYATPRSNLTVDNSTLVVDGFVRADDTTTLKNAKIYMYDANNAEDRFHALSIKNLDIAGSNELFLRADSSKAAGNIGRFELNSDVIGISGNITGEGKFDVNVFDKGMKNGYGMKADGIKSLANPITVIYTPNSAVNAASLINKINDMHYDNGIWNYTYDDMRAVSDGNKIVIKEVYVKAAPSASGSQRSLHSANKAAGALAIGVLGNDNALHAHLREAQGAGEREEVYAQYLGGKLKSDGMQLKHNGVELGYDAYVGSNWTFGVSGMQTRGNTQLDSGSGKAKTNVGTVYGAWHGGSTYLNLEAKAGRVSSESKTFGGTVLQKIAGEFSAPAYSVSAEYGSTHELPAAWYLEPAVRLSYVHMGAADYSVRTQETLAHVANDSLDSFILRGGAKLGRRLGAKGSFYVKAAAVYDFGGDLATTLSADGRTPAYYEGDLGGWGVEYGAGMEYKLGKAANISLDVERRSGGELKRDWGVNVGVNYSF